MSHVPHEWNVLHPKLRALDLAAMARDLQANRDEPDAASWLAELSDAMERLRVEKLHYFWLGADA